MLDKLNELLVEKTKDLKQDGYSFRAIQSTSENHFIGIVCKYSETPKHTDQECVRVVINQSELENAADPIALFNERFERSTKLLK